MRDKMKMDSMLFLLLGVTGSLIPGCKAYEYCTWLLSCYDGYYCCNYNTQCCSDVILSVGAIVGIVIGCIVFISIVIAVICVCMKSKGRTGQVISPSQPAGGHVTVISSGQYPQQQYGQPIYGQQHYGQPPFGQAPTQFGAQPGVKQNNPGQDMAYPPPPAAY